MKSPRTRTIVFVIVLLGLLAWAVHVVRWKALPVVGEQAHDGYQRVSGVVHVHTTLSDGAATPDEVIAAARAAGLDFVVITDHNNLEAKKWEGYHDGLLVIVGTEVSTTAGHVLGLGIADPVFRFSGDAYDALDDVAALGGAAFAAHPTSPRSDFKWTGWDLPGSWGLEVVNGDSQWRAAGWLRLARTLALYPLNHEYALLGSLTPSTEALARWDALLARRPAAAIAGADAHGQVPVRKDRTLRFPSYVSLFRVARNHVLLSRPLTGDASVDGPAIVRALALGRSFVGLDALAPADGFSFTTAGGPGTSSRRSRGSGCARVAGFRSGRTSRCCATAARSRRPSTPSTRRCPGRACTAWRRGCRDGTSHGSSRIRSRCSRRRRPRPAASRQPGPRPHRRHRPCV